MTVPEPIALPGLDPATAGLLAMIAESGAPPLHELPLPVAREVYDQTAAFGGDPALVGRVSDMSADGVPARVYWPEGDGTHPVLIWLHGGGWTVGGVEAADRTARALCQGADCMVVSVDYRLAPEHPFPAGVDDARTAAEWVIKEIGSLGGDPARLAIGGDSAGGNLSAVVTNELPGTFAAQVLVYPATDLTLDHASISELGHSQLLTKEAMQWFRNHYAAGADWTDPRLSPLYASPEVLATAPPTLVITGDLDPLRDENVEYVRRLREAGATVDHARYPGQIHAFFELSGVIQAALQARARVVQALRDAWA
ncbi:acetyl esterase [Kibdelosporangium banguiense]|uniref:Acetyl esterase n=1 Tax=Kibdelosporangium banguiense TaxID=1365924 RepID=A0ABS4TQ95_9PSEU|nr:alpha/beta hydrolase [Kibdelosporangium banguiense]MBP2326578.1 acetyl esterase [Kibdelosporangium banguiense]